VIVVVVVLVALKFRNTLVELLAKIPVVGPMIL
jgi:hypothetical protein